MSAKHDRIDSRHLTRRGLLGGAVGGMAVLAGLSSGQPAMGQEGTPREPAVVKGRIKQSVCAWCFKPMDLETLARNCVAMGLRSIELVSPKDWGILKKYGLVCALTSSHGFVNGWNHKENHAMCLEKTTAAIDATAAAGFPSVITFSGFRRSIPDDVGMENTVEGLKKVIGYAERKKVNLVFEVLNSRVNVEMKGHPDYMADRIEWAIEVCKRISSERMKILFDIYHVQIMQGDVITRIRQYHPFIGHYHTAGVPGRNELDENQELNYPAIMRVVAETGYTGYVGQEFVPTRDSMKSLWESVRLCDV